MTTHIDPQTQTPKTLGQIRREHPKISIPDGADLTHLGYATLETTAKPEPNPNHTVTEVQPEEYEPGKWRQTWQQVPIEIEPVRERKQRQRITKLEATREAGFGFNGHTVASDLKSQLLIQGSAQLAQLAIAQGTQQALDDFAASLGAGWRAADGAVVASSAAEIISMAQAFAGHVAACDANSQALKQAIIDAETVADLEAIDLDAGWPA